MDEELLKRNTDCVYFLASPLTCKKGVDCEYRHSEMARLNPRDCWYWQSGNCLNPTCGFRHPPMDTHAETSAEAELLTNSTSLPPSKNNVPCYFYYNGYCGKGDKCSFLHGSEDSSAGKHKIDSASTGAPTLDSRPPSKASVPKITVEKPDAKPPFRAVPNITAQKSDGKVPSTLLDTNRRARVPEGKVCPITEPLPDLPEKGLALCEVALKTGDRVPLHQKFQIQSPDTYAIVEQKTLQHSVASEFEEPAIYKSAFLNPSESIYSDQSSEDLVDKDVVRDEWESSPGFDVLVEGKSEGMIYGDEQDYMHGYNAAGYHGNDEDHHRYRDQNDFGDTDRFLHENRISEVSYFSDDDEGYDLNPYSHGDRGRNHIMPQKRKFLTVGLPFGPHHHSGDLREHLSKRRFHAERDAFMDPNFPLHTEERPNQRLHGRLASKLERNGVSLIPEKSAFVVPDQRGRARNKQLTTRHHRHHERKRQQMPSRAHRRPFSRQKRESNTNISFTAPKTLAQIKEEKDRARCKIRHSSRNSSVGFDGPKPLTEILQVKKRGSSCGEEDININISS